MRRSEEDGLGRSCFSGIPRCRRSGSCSECCAVTDLMHCDGEGDPLTLTCGSARSSGAALRFETYEVMLLRTCLKQD